VLTGGELPALVIMDAITRLLPGALGDAEAPEKDSHATGLLEHPHYTRPAVFRGQEVPEILRSGNHAQIEHWRRQESLRRTWQRRPKMLQNADLSEEDWTYIHTLQQNKDLEP
jgi:tRNA (guanine37-N1)-methyltransferase